MKLRLIILVVAAVGFLSASNARAQKTLLNVSDDPTREFYKEFNPAFSKSWQAKSGETVSFRQAHGGSGAQLAPLSMGWRRTS
jgi:ABC-type sulfate transport system substrate-binding protein